MKVRDKVWVRSKNIMGVRQSSDKKIVERFIIGETNMYWILGTEPNSDIKTGTRIKKSNVNEYLFTSEGPVAKAEWIDENKVRIMQMVNCCDQYITLKLVDSVLKGTLFENYEISKKIK